MRSSILSELPTFDSDTGDLHTIIEAPGGSRNKFKYDPRMNVVKFDKTLPAGLVFPREFGFIPSTLGEDGDPLDVLLFVDGPMYPGILAPARLLGVIQAEQTEKGETKRNDRIIAVAIKCQEYKNVKALADLDPDLLRQIEQFFATYNREEGKEFKPIGRADAAQAKELIEQGQKLFAGRKKR